MCTAQGRFSSPSIYEKIDYEKPFYEKPFMTASLQKLDSEFLTLK